MFKEELGKEVVRNKLFEAFLVCVKDHKSEHTNFKYKEELENQLSRE